MTPVSSVMGNVTVAFAALSYAGTLAVTVVADPDHCPDLTFLGTQLQDQLDQLVRKPITVLGARWIAESSPLGRNSLAAVTSESPSSTSTAHMRLAAGRAHSFEDGFGAGGAPNGRR